MNSALETCMLQPKQFSISTLHYDKRGRNSGLPMGKGMQLEMFYHITVLVFLVSNVWLIDNKNVRSKYCIFAISSAGIYIIYTRLTISISSFFKTKKGKNS